MICENCECYVDRLVKFRSVKVCVFYELLESDV